MSIILTIILTIIAISKKLHILLIHFCITLSSRLGSLDKYNAFDSTTNYLCMPL